MERRLTEKDEQRAFDVAEPEDWKFPHLAQKIIVHSMKGKRNPMSCFLGYKPDFVGPHSLEARPNLAITYFTQMPIISILDKPQQPRTLIVNAGANEIMELQRLFPSEQGKPLEKFLIHALNELKIAIPPNGSWYYNDQHKGPIKIAR